MPAFHIAMLAFICIMGLQIRICGRGIRMKQQMMERFPGISCAYVDAAGKEGVECYGVSDKEKNILVDDHTVFPACSVSKFVTAICLMRLQEEDVINIDAKVNDYLQRWKLLTMDGEESDVTIRALMCHTAGIVDGEDSFYGIRRGEPEIKLMDILKGKTFYHNRPVRTNDPQGKTYEYSDAGYCVLQLLVEETMNKAFEEVVQKMIFDKLALTDTFFATLKNLEHFENSKHLATGYDGDGLPIPGRFLPCPDLAASGLWSTPKELLKIAKEFVASLNGKSDLLQEKSAREMAKPVDKFPWTGLGIFIGGEDILITQGWGENGQCMMKMNCRTGGISVVMTNRNPEMEQSASGVEWLVNRKLCESNPTIPLMV